MTHLEDIDNARAAYERALQLDQKDPAIAVNYANLLFFHAQDNVASGAQLKAMEERIAKLREAGLDADPDVSGNAGRRDNLTEFHPTSYYVCISGFVPRRKIGLQVEHLADRGRGG